LYLSIHRGANMSPFLLERCAQAMRAGHQARFMQIT
jgi:hypothetical protein